MLCRALCGRTSEQFALDFSIFNIMNSQGLVSGSWVGALLEPEVIATGQ